MRISKFSATKIYRLNFISPKIVEAIVNGTAPRDLRLQDIFAKKSARDLAGAGGDGVF